MHIPKEHWPCIKIPKVHAISGVAEDAKKFGCLANSDTEAGERSQKILKAASKFVNHNDQGPNLPLLKRIVSTQLDAASSPEAAQAG